ncbi:MAG: hypothetical protein BWY98_00575 [Tenericutes bacterium ADurb.BinA155]|nr:MAG: hypothetical protein BWY98_00575 [Tenericutes bacterium ADurb.BinA155]
MINPLTEPSPCPTFVLRGDSMAIYSIRLSPEEKQALEAYAKLHHISMAAALKKGFFTLLEDELDLQDAEAAYALFKEDPKSVSYEELAKRYGL